MENRIEQYLNLILKQEYNLSLDQELRRSKSEETQFFKKNFSVIMERDTALRKKLLGVAPSTVSYLTEEERNNPDIAFHFTCHSFQYHLAQSSVIVGDEKIVFSAYQRIPFFLNDLESYLGKTLKQDRLFMKMFYLLSQLNGLIAKKGIESLCQKETTSKDYNVQANTGEVSYVLATRFAVFYRLIHDKMKQIEDTAEKENKMNQLLDTYINPSLFQISSLSDFVSEQKLSKQRTIGTCHIIK